MEAASTPGIARRGLILILSSPSGTGKTTLTRRLVAAEPGIEVSVSATTRAPRGAEIDGRHYHFTDRPGFERLAAEGGLLEWAEVHGNLYGTPRAPVERALGEGRDMIFDIDIQGAAQVRALLPGDVVGVFVLPPSLAELRRRLEARAEDAPATIERRMAAARREIAHWAEYDYALVNDDIEATFAALRAILSAERLRRARRVGLGGFVDGLLSEG